MNEVRGLRQNGDLSVDRNNTSRYRIIARESDGSNTAYYFSSPIYNLQSRKLVELRFLSAGYTFSALGSNAGITVSANDVIIRNEEGLISASWGAQQYYQNGRNIVSQAVELYPTLNGVAVKAKRRQDESFKIRIFSDRPNMNIRGNSKYFALMCEEFKPFMAVSAIGGTNSFGRICSPALVSCQQIDDRNYAVHISAVSNVSASVVFEINLYEPKLFQDTTVESKNPNENNAFGGVAFIGESETFGEQWLYSRLDYAKISDIVSKEIRKAMLHVPQYNDSKSIIDGFLPVQRFCSFGSTWENRIAYAAKAAESSAMHSYQSIDLTNILSDSRNRSFSMPEGLVLKSKAKGGGYCIIATGDNYFTPQILEINFK